MNYQIQMNKTTIWNKKYLNIQILLKTMVERIKCKNLRFWIDSSKFSLMLKHLQFEQTSIFLLDKLCMHPKFYWENF